MIIEEFVCVSDVSVYDAWIAENCRPKQGNFVSCADAFAAWEKFAIGRGELTAGSMQALGRAMKRNRLQASRKMVGGKNTRGYNDIAIIPKGSANV